MIVCPLYKVEITLEDVLASERSLMVVFNLKYPFFLTQELVFLAGFFTGFLIIWITINSVIAFGKPIDPYPFILLNLLLSCLAAIQAPIIMMSQNRQEAKDRLRSQYDYQVNLKAELEIRQLHEKMDHLLSHQWERLTQIQEIQIDLLEEIRRKDK